MPTASSRREHLLEVGLRELRSTGNTATGVKEVLELAQVPKGSFYHYFSSKEAIVPELLNGMPCRRESGLNESSRTRQFLP